MTLPLFKVVKLTKTWEVWCQRCNQRFWVEKELPPGKGMSCPYCYKASRVPGIGEGR